MIQLWAFEDEMHRNIVSGSASILRERRLCGIIMHPLTQVQASKYVKALVQLRGVQDRRQRRSKWSRGSEAREHQLAPKNLKKAISRYYVTARQSAKRLVCGLSHVTVQPGGLITRKRFNTVNPPKLNSSVSSSFIHRNTSAGFSDRDNPWDAGGTC